MALLSSQLPTHPRFSRINMDYARININRFWYSFIRPSVVLMFVDLKFGHQDFTWILNISITRLYHRFFWRTKKVGLDTGHEHVSVALIYIWKWYVCSCSLCFGYGLKPSFLSKKPIHLELLVLYQKKSNVFLVSLKIFCAFIRQISYRILSCCIE